MDTLGTIPPILEICTPYIVVIISIVIIKALPLYLSTSVVVGALLVQDLHRNQIFQSIQRYISRFLSRRAGNDLHLKPAPMGRRHQRPIDVDINTAPPRPHRVDFDGDGCTVNAYPSTGEIVIKAGADAVDLEFLGLDRLDPEMYLYEDQDAEDLFAKRLLMVGGKRWDDEQKALVVQEWRRGKLRMEGFQPERERYVERVFGYVGRDGEGGVWVMDDEDSDSVILGREEKSEGWEEEEWRWGMQGGEERVSRVRMARSMKERCVLMERWRFCGGSKFYESVDECEELMGIFGSTGKGEKGS